MSLEDIGPRPQTFDLESRSRHNVTHIGDEPMHVFTVYAPQHHGPGAVHQTKAIADTAD